MRDVLDCYKILDIPPGSPATTVRKAYVELSHVWQPENYVTNPVLRKKAEERIREIQEAYDVIRGFLPELNAPTDEKDEAPARPPDEVLLVAESEHSPMFGVVAIILLLVIVTVCFSAWVLYARHRGVMITFLG